MEKQHSAGWHGERRPLESTAEADRRFHGDREPDRHETARPGGSERDSDVDLAFAALADPTRRQILERLGEGRPLSASAIAADLPVSRQAVAQHLLALQQAALVESRRSGREVLFRVRPEGLTRTAAWMTALAATWSERLSSDPLFSAQTR